MRTRETVELLNHLIQTCRDGEELCRVVGDIAQTADLRALLRHCSEEWGRLSNELQALVLLLDGAPATSPTRAARLRQWWLTAKSALIGADDPSIVKAWEDAQREALERYEEALSGYLPERIRRTVAFQADRISDRREQIHALRGQYAMHSQRV